MKQFAQAGQEPVVQTPDGGQRRVLSHGGGLMMVQVTFDAGVTSWQHAHPHEQISYVVSGEVDFMLEGMEARRLLAGGSCYIPPNVNHYVVTHAPTILVDCFSPIREDFLENGQDA